MTTVVAFAGPSLASADRRGYPLIDWRGPAEAGDLLRLRPAEGTVVCLIDGYFDHRPAVRHKEILLLLSRGIAIFGAASIGALRAAEMSPYGMIGIGAIYRAYASDRLSGDDEVALIHAPGRLDWKALSLPLVDCRATLHHAVRRRFLAPQEAREMLRAAREVFYADRDWPAVLRATSLTAARRRAILAWVERHGVSQKRLDALACLDAAYRPVVRPCPPPMVRTSLLEALARECGLELRELR